MEQTTNDFVPDLFMSRKDNAPDFVLCKQSFKVDQFCKWLKANANEKGYVNIDILKAKTGKIYAKKNYFKPTAQAPATTKEESDDLPF